MTAKNETTESQAGDRGAPPKEHRFAGEIIPVGQEPRLCADTNSPTSDTGTASRMAGEGENGAEEGEPGSQGRRKDSNGQRVTIRNPDAFHGCRKQLFEQAIFRRETMRYLRRAEICVWNSIHGCQDKEGARISQQRIAELSGIEGKRHVVEAIKDLCDKGLLEVLVKGRYRPNGADKYGLASRYRAYPRPEPRLARIPLEKVKRRPDSLATTDVKPDGLQKRNAK